MRGKTRLHAARATFLALCAAAPLTRGLDHIPVAVANLADATSDFQKLGFTLKPGRPHTNGIQNAHIKFADHTEIELITVTQPTDALANEYAAFIQQGDGPAFWSLYAPDLLALKTRLTQLHLTPASSGEILTFSQDAFPHRLFFANREPSPTDEPAYFTHANTAIRLEAIWLATNSPERRLLHTIGAATASGAACAPFPITENTLALPEAQIIPVPPAAGAPPLRAIIGATILVTNLRAARAFLARNGITPALTCQNASLWITPSKTHGLWLELKQSPSN